MLLAGSAGLVRAGNKRTSIPKRQTNGQPRLAVATGESPVGYTLSGNLCSTPETGLAAEYPPGVGHRLRLPKQRGWRQAEKLAADNHWEIRDPRPKSASLAARRRNVLHTPRKGILDAPAATAATEPIRPLKSQTIHEEKTFVADKHRGIRVPRPKPASLAARRRNVLHTPRKGILDAPAATAATERIRPLKSQTIHEEKTFAADNHREKLRKRPKSASTAARRRNVSQTRPGCGPRPPALVYGLRRSSGCLSVLELRLDAPAGLVDPTANFCSSKLDQDTQASH